ncbi:MAG: XRE family transcriptional regulator [Burkholderiaceae bacterium]|nr:XRE family transcriptional regulator [Burkholderiaceae bacterium]
MMNKTFQLADSGRLFRSEMIGLRRRMLSLSQADLSTLSEITQGALSKIEQGIKEPSNELVARLATALKCPVSFFFQAEREYGLPISAHAMFRKKTSTSQKVIDRVIAELNVRIAHMRKFLSAVEFSPELPFPVYDLDDFEGKPDAVAENVRRAWLMPRGPIRSLTEYAERAGCIVVPCDMEAAKIDGVSYRIPGLPPLVFLNRNQPADRMRFSLAHEIGHLVMHAYPSPSMEQEANQFASALLMPAADIGPELHGLTIEKAAYMKPVWRVSMASMIYRASDLNKIDRYKAEYLWRQMAMRGFRVREPQAVDFAPEKTSLIDALVENLTEEMKYSPEELEELLHLRHEELVMMYALQQKSVLRVVK